MKKNSKNQVTVIGGANIDIVARYAAPQHHHSESHQGVVSTSAGGVARNIAENLAHLGRSVRLICAMGDDDFAATIKTSITLPLIDTKACHVSGGAASDMYLNVFDHGGEVLHAINTMALIDLLTPDYLKTFENDLKSSALIVADCNLSQNSLDWLVGLDGRPNLYCDGVSPEKIIKLKPHLGRIDGLKCNQKEAAELLDLPPETAPSDLMKQLVQRGISTIILSLGQNGVLCHQGGNQVDIPHPEKPQKIISVSGAGDALFAGYIHGCLDGLPQDQAINLGLAAAQLTLGCPHAVNPDISSLTTSEQA